MSQGAPAWGTPPGEPGDGAGEPGTGRFVVIVEQQRGSGDSLRWAVEPLPDAVHPTRHAARIAALETARRLDPRHPMSEQGRRVYRIAPDEYLVVVTGMTSTFHFRVSVGEEIG